MEKGDASVLFVLTACVFCAYISLMMLCQCATADIDNHPASTIVCPSSGVRETHSPKSTTVKYTCKCCVRLAKLSEVRDLLMDVMKYLGRRMLHLADETTTTEENSDRVSGRRSQR